MHDRNFAGLKHNISEQVLSLVKLICIDRIDSWQIKEKKEWLDFKKNLKDCEAKTI